MTRMISKMPDGECRMTNCRASVSVPKAFGIHRTPCNIRALSFFSSPLAERTLFGFVISHGHATHLVRSVGFQDCYAERKSSARRSVAVESCFRKCEGRNRRAQTC